MVNEVHVKGYENFKNLLQTSKFAGPAYILFSGEKVDGVSWCSDCNDSEPFIKDAIKNLAPANATVIHVDVGDRPFWKDMKNPFRHDATIGKIQVIPTFIQFGSPKRLEGVEQLSKPDLLEMFFEEDD